MGFLWTQEAQYYKSRLVFKDENQPAFVYNIFIEINIVKDYSVTLADCSSSTVLMTCSSTAMSTGLET